VPTGATETAGSERYSRLRGADCLLDQGGGGRSPEVRLGSNRLLDVRGRADREWSRIHPVTCVCSLDWRIWLVQICKLWADGDESARVIAAGAPGFGADVSAAVMVGAGNAGLVTRQWDARGGAGKSCGGNPVAGSRRCPGKGHERDCSQSCGGALARLVTAHGVGRHKRELSLVNRAGRGVAHSKRLDLGSRLDRCGAARRAIAGVWAGVAVPWSSCLRISTSSTCPAAMLLVT
jgi:hypothetical protein